MLRKLLLLGAIAVTAVALNASTAAAQGVHVENTGHHAVESELGLAIGVHVPGIGFIPSLRCAVRGEVDIAEDGSFLLNAEDIESHAGSVGDCDVAEPCNGHAAWPGFVSEDGLGGFQVHADFCLENVAPALAGNVYPVECDVEVNAGFDSLHCDQAIDQLPPAQGGFVIEVEGEALADESTGLMHAED